MRCNQRGDLLSNEWHVLSTKQSSVVQIITYLAIERTAYNTRRLGLLARVMFRFLKTQITEIKNISYMFEGYFVNR